jgi:hypothetical protein
MATIKDLHKAVEAVAPIHGVSREKINFKDDATPDQKAAAAEVLRTFDWQKEAPKPIAPLSDDEIRWVRDQMKARVDALR